MIDKVFVDSDIILDLIQERGNYADAVRLFTLIEENKVRGYVSPLIFANLFYILRKQESNKFALQVLIRLKALFNILTLNEKVIELALSSGFKDFEDAVQYYSALEENCGYLITRNKGDYKQSGIIICNAKEYCAIRDSETR
ncbi:MAG: PIN domain-containing protein [Chitinispirillaceae bacterium]|nr:PIN domain-containing protein [Chitinispirillaceae bacterium]